MDGFGLVCEFRIDSWEELVPEVVQIWFDRLARRNFLVKAREEGLLPPEGLPGCPVCGAHPVELTVLSTGERGCWKCHARFEDT